MKTDGSDIDLIALIHKQYREAAEEAVRRGLRYVLKDILGRFLLQIKRYEPWASREAIAKAGEYAIDLSRVKIHDCNVKDAVALSPEQRKLFADHNRPTEFHLEHDPPTLQVVDSILKDEAVSGEKIAEKLERYRLCFVTRDENKRLDAKGYHSKRPPAAYEECGIEAEKL
ncbi:MAG: hypothetical protein LBC51_07505 [Treponema sp.]|jgi:hypothetical protein|nr:hypothetical protein [Treponema sp.]